MIISRQAVYLIILVISLGYLRKRLSAQRLFQLVLLIVVSGIHISYAIRQQQAFEEKSGIRNLPEEPEQFSGMVIDDLSGRKKGLAAFTIDGKFSFFDSKIRLRIRVPDAPWREESLFRRGDTVKCFIALPQHSPKDFSSRLKFLWSGILMVATIPPERSLEYYCQRVSSGNLPPRQAEKIFEELLGNSSASPVGASILLASTMGRGEYVESWVQDLFKNTGLYHLLVVSGYHLGVLACVVLYFIKLLTGRCTSILGCVTRKECMAFGVWAGMLWFLLAGQIKPPLVRASIMMILFTFASMSGRKSSITRSLLWSLVIIHLAMPLAILNPGVQFSYAALTGVIGGLFAARKISEYIDSGETVVLPDFRKRRGQPKYLLSLFMTSTGAYLCILPLQVYWFSTWTPYAIICNMVFAPLFSLLVVGLGIILVFVRMTGIPGSEHLLVYHTIVVEKIVDLVLWFYHFLAA